MKHPVAFMSYVRLDDHHENGRLTDFCARLSGEVRIQTGAEFGIFQDRNDIAWGQQWKARITESIDAVTFLIPIITPAFFRSPACREELERFLQREGSLGRADLVLPVYYVETPTLSVEARRHADKLAQVIADRQHVDWRELRFEPLTSPEVGKRLAKIARQICDALDRGQQTHSPQAAVVHPAPAPHQPTPPRGESNALHQKASSEHREKKETPTLVVDAFRRGDHATLADALRAANPGDRIVVRPGLYKEGVVVDKPVEIFGDGEAGDVVIEATGRDVILFQANMGRIVNLTLRQVGGGEWYGVDIAQGRLDLEDCDVSSQSLACVAIHGGAHARLRRNRVHHGSAAGIHVYENAVATLEDNDIFSNAGAGVSVRLSTATIRSNRVHDGKSGGIHFYDAGDGTVEDNDIFSNSGVGVSINTDANPIVRRNRIHDGKTAGFHIYSKGFGRIEDNEIFSNSSSGVYVASGGNPVLKGNRISKNKYEAIWIGEGGAGTYEDNDLRGNGRKGAWDLGPDDPSGVQRYGNLEDPTTN